MVNYTLCYEIEKQENKNNKFELEMSTGRVLVFRDFTRTGRNVLEHGKYCDENLLKIKEFDRFL